MIPRTGPLQGRAGHICRDSARLAQDSGGGSSVTPCLSASCTPRAYTRHLAGQGLRQPLPLPAPAAGCWQGEGPPTCRDPGGTEVAGIAASAPTGLPKPGCSSHESARLRHRGRPLVSVLTWISVLLRPPPSPAAKLSPADTAYLAEVSLLPGLWSGCSGCISDPACSKPIKAPDFCNASPLYP